MFLGITDIWTYAVGALLLILLPGPNSLYVLSLAAQRGVRDGYRAATGVFVGDTLLMTLSAAGAASLLKASPPAFTVVKGIGAAYLAWIGFQMIRGAVRSLRGKSGRPAVQRETPVERPFRKALIVSLLNPKAILFFVSFFVQFVDPAYSAPVVSFLILGAIIQLFSVLYLTLLIFGGTYLANQFRARRKLASGLTVTVGVVFLGFSAKLASTGL